MPQTPLKRGDRGGGVRQEAAQGIPAGGGDSGTPGPGVTEGGGSVPSRKSRKLEPASVRAPRAWHQLPGRTESSPNSPGGGETTGPQQPWGGRDHRTRPRSTPGAPWVASQPCREEGGFNTALKRNYWPLKTHRGSSQGIKQEKKTGKRDEKEFR